jgi:hypothetical protein
MAKDKQVPDKLISMFPQYTRKELYFMLYPFWTGVSDRFKRKKSDVSAVSITVKGLGRFEFKSNAKMRKSATLLRKRITKKLTNYKRKQELKTDKLIY